MHAQQVPRGHWQLSSRLIGSAAGADLSSCCTSPSSPRDESESSVPYSSYKLTQSSLRRNSAECTRKNAFGVRRKAINVRRVWVFCDECVWLSREMKRKHLSRSQPKRRALITIPVDADNKPACAPWCYFQHRYIYAFASQHQWHWETLKYGTMRDFAIHTIARWGSHDKNWEYTLLFCVNYQFF